MPFTLSHAVAVLPAMRRTGAARGPLIASALVLGSFAPDVPYFLGLWSLGGGLAHSPLGVVTVDVLITLVLFGFWVFAREPLVALVPSRWGSRIVAAAGPGRLSDRSRASVAVWFAISAAIGSATHIAWDAFTHAGRIGVRAFPVLAEPVLFDRPLFSFLQYGSSALGLAVLAVYLVRLNPPDRQVDLPTWPASARVVLLGVLAASCLLPGVAAFVPVVRLGFDAVPIVAFAAGAGLGFGLAVYAVGARLYWAVSGRTPQVEEAE